MIAAHLTDKDGKDCILLVLEPGNIEKLRLGKPVIKQLREFMPHIERDVELCIAFTPDAEWVAKQWRKNGDLAKALDDSLGRKEVFLPNSEALVKEKLGGGQ